MTFAVVVGILDTCPPHISNAVQPAPDPIFHYIITRRDLPLGLRDAQIIHAARHSGCLAASSPDEEYAGALWVRDEAALLALAEVLERDGVSHRRVVENDAPYTGQLMAIGCAPARKSTLRRYLSSIPRIKDPQ